MKHILGTEVGWLSGTKVSVEDNKFRDFHTCYLTFKAGSVTMFVISMIRKSNVERKINIRQTNRKKGRRITYLTPDHAQIFRQQNTFQFSFVYLTFHLYYCTDLSSTTTKGCFHRHRTFIYMFCNYFQNFLDI